MRIQEEEETLNDYAQPVYVSLVHPIRFMGIGETAALLIACFTTVLMMIVSKLCIVIGIVAFLVLKQICKNEPYMVDFLMDNLNQADSYIG